MFNKELHTILEFVPKNKHSLVKNKLSLSKSITVEDKTTESWMYDRDWDIIKERDTNLFSFKASEFTNKLSANMFVFGNNVMFIEWKGIEGYHHPKVTLLSLDLGYIKYTSLTGE